MYILNWLWIGEVQLINTGSSWRSSPCEGHLEDEPWPERACSGEKLANCTAICYYINHGFWL